MSIFIFAMYQNYPLALNEWLNEWIDYTNIDKNKLE